MNTAEKKPAVLTGADRLVNWAERNLQGARIGLLTNPTGVNRQFRSTVDVCADLTSVKLTALYACEHGIRGERQAGVLFEDETDDRLGIPVYSLYGKSKKPTAEMLEHVDAVLFDIQDLGVRFYTYMTTMLYMMEACAQAGKTFVLLDRPNPLGGNVSEGGMLVPGFESMVGGFAVPFRTGLTLGEFAGYVNSRIEPACDLRVVPLEGWSRDMEFPDTGLPWIMPSPNMPTMDTVRVYTGNCLFEGANLSEGRGTTKPFEQVGAPWIDGAELSRVMNGYGLPGVHFHPVTFTPMFSKHQGALCGGVQTFVTDKTTYRSLESGLTLLHTIARMYGENFEWIAPFKEGRKHFIDYLTGSDLVRTSIGEEAGLQNIVKRWSVEAEAWMQERKPFLLYEEGERQA
ncbi:exo-beta-N-acetylmuramidase NamZ domain-containing protein [Paenibacillus sp. MBLB4367]|uniref:exo-beta-N-acetylmuramidase NamZ family protein n=1 Tax=Paenibacillus sp. MBLB4367 TaxID=3384767 RepID=UPI0039082B19